MWIKKVPQFILILVIITGWIFSGWPQIGNFPPRIERAEAAGCSTAALGTGTDVGAATIAPGTGIADRGVFTITGSGTSCTVKVTAVTVTLAAAGTPYNGLAEVSITNSAGSTTYFSAVTSFSGNTVSFSGGTTIPVGIATAGAVVFKIRVTPKTHANMDPVPGASYAITPYISAWTTTLTKSGSDTNPNTTTIDNLSPTSATVPLASTSGVGKTTLKWTSSSASDFQTTNGSIILRWANSTPGAEVPVEGATYTAGNTIVGASTATVACVISSATSAALSKIDGTGGDTGCTTTALTGGQQYSYKVFSLDTNGNYDVGTTLNGSPLTPTSIPGAPTIGTATAGDGQASVTFTPPASDGGSTITGYTVISTPGSFTGTGSASPISVTGLANGTAYTFTVHATNAVGDSPESSASNSVTPAAAPTVTTQAATNVGVATITGNGNITATGGQNATAWGVCYKISSGCTTADSVAAGSGTGGTGAFTASMSSLLSGTLYYMKAYATNPAGTSYGSEVSTTTKPAAPTNVAATKNLSDKVTITWTQSTGATNYHVWRDSTDLGATGDVATYDDSTAGAPSLTSGTASATDGSATDRITLSISGASASNGTSYTYKVVASNSSGNSADSTTDTGYRAPGSLTYQWYRSSGTGDTGYGVLSGATTAPYDDTGAPAPTITAGAASASDGTSLYNVGLSISGQSANAGAVRYYYATVSATGASSADTAHDFGNIGVGSLTYQWQRSAGDSDATYSDIVGATTAGYSDVDAPADGSGRYYKVVEDATGATQQTSTSNRGYKKIVSISLTTNGSVNFGYVPKNTPKDSTASGVNDVEVVQIDSGPSDLDIESTIFSQGGNTWTLGSGNGDNIAKWEFSKDGTNWSTFLNPAPTSYVFDTNVSESSTRNIYFKITTPTATNSYQQYDTTITIVASAP